MAAAMLIALSLDLALGWPQAWLRRIGHPVTWLGWLIARLEARWNRPHLAPATRIALGGLASALVILAATLPALAVALAVALALPPGWAFILVTGVLAWPLLAARSMAQHVRAVEAPLAQGDLPAARRAVSMIVGRDTARLDTAGVARAATESLAENASDGVVAPLVWGVFLGLPGIAAYKAINTLDSMIGHRSARYHAFGRLAARLDDAVNWIPARLTALVYAGLAARPRAAFALMLRDARHHRSPNAGWPEAAMAAALGVRLSGPRSYGEGIRDEPWVNEGAPDPGAADLGRALRLSGRGLAVLAVGLAALAVLLR
ncbi:MAG: adenosylcobinamide-phosphate synthase CbiB [Pseudomonadota bacterium]